MFFDKGSFSFAIFWGTSTQAIGISFEDVYFPERGDSVLTVPIYSSPGRFGIGPQLTLFYDSGSGSGPFGLGWGLSLPSVTRKTQKGIPQYGDPDEGAIRWRIITWDNLYPEADFFQLWRNNSKATINFDLFVIQGDSVTYESGRLVFISDHRDITAVPLPSALVLLASGLLPLAYYRRKFSSCSSK